MVSQMSVMWFFGCCGHEMVDRSLLINKNVGYFAKLSSAGSISIDVLACHVTKKPQPDHFIPAVHECTGCMPLLT